MRGALSDRGVERAMRRQLQRAAFDAADVVAAPVDALVLGGEVAVRPVDDHLHARLRARGDLAGAARDAKRALELGRSFGAPQLLYPALAFAARVEAASTDLDAAAQLANELLGAWAETKEKTLPSFWVADLAFVMRALDRGDELEGEVSSGVPSTRWLDAATAVARGDDERARELFAAIGSQPDVVRAGFGSPLDGGAPAAPPFS